MRLMVVDDDPAALELVQALVEPLGYEVLALTDSRQAAECVNEQKFDAIFVDVQMPNLDGFELTQLIRASRSNSGIPIVMITALEDIETMRQGYKAGVTFFLTKPFNPEKLRGLLLTMRNTILRERTRYARLPFCTTVTCRRGNEQFQLGSLNISECGMLFESSSGLEPGQEIRPRLYVLAGPGASKPASKDCSQRTAGPHGGPIPRPDFRRSGDYSAVHRPRSQRVGLRFVRLEAIAAAFFPEGKL